MSTTFLIPSLPDELAVNCLACVPRSKHETLSLVSKPIRSLLYSLHFFNAHSTIYCTHHILYFTVNKPFSTQALAFPSQWFTLTLHHSRRFFPLFPTPFREFMPSVATSLPMPPATFGSLTPSSIVGRKGPQCPSLTATVATIINNHIYIMGYIRLGYDETYSANWVNFLDPTSNRWETIPSQPEVQRRYMPYAAVVVDGKICIKFADGGTMLVFNTQSGTLKDVDLGWVGRPCVVDGIVYCPNNFRGVKGFDLRETIWKMVKGLAGVPGLPLNVYNARMIEVGGHLVMINHRNREEEWKEMEVHVAEIKVTKDDDGKLWGNIFANDVLTLPVVTRNETFSAVVV